MLLQRCGPRQQLCPLSLCQLFVGPKRAGHALQDDAPAFGHGVIVGLEKNVIVDCRAHQLGALRSAEKHGAVLDDEIDREDLGLTVDACDESPESDAGKQIPAFVGRQNGDGLTGLRYRGIPRLRAGGIRMFAHISNATTALSSPEASFVPNVEDFRPCPSAQATMHIVFVACANPPDRPIPLLQGTYKRHMIDSSELNR